VTRIVFVHGSFGNAASTWAGQRVLDGRFELVFLTRSGYPPGPLVDRIDFEQQADDVAQELRAGDHLVGHSYGGVVSLLAASRGPALASLTVSEPPAFDVARGHPAVEKFIATFADGVPTTPRAYLEFFLPLVGSTLPPGEMSPELEQGARAALAERSPHEASIPLVTLRAAPFPKLVISGAHHPAFDAICDVLERELPAERAVVPGARHSLPRAPGYNDVLTEFVERST
jgi:pimeloyl-ACP methyl ester carboxylesterase